MMKNVFVLVVLVAAACGGKNKNNVEQGGDPQIDPNATTGDPTDYSGQMIDPQKMDEVNQLLDRKRRIVSRCLSDAVESGEVPKNSARGKITLSISISTSGKATRVEVIKSSIQSKEVQGCVKRKVEEIAFPQLVRQYDTSYTYGMEAF